MSRKPEPVATPSVIKWTEEEWQMIALRLLEEKGRGLLESAQLDEVRAKDVFSAQSVLPENRHRKLISVSQGFQAIRQRLHGIMQKMAPRPEHDLFAAPATAPGKEDPAANAPAADQLTSQPSVHSGKVRPGPVAGMPPVAGREPAALAETGTGQAVTQEPHRKDTSVTEATAPAEKQTQPVARPDVPSSSRQTAKAPRHAHLAQAQSQRNGQDLTELARPFVAMVCEEFVSALIRTLTEKGGNQAIASLFQAAAPRMATSSAYRQQEHRSFAPSSGHEGPAPEPDLSSAASQAADDEDAYLAESDVQPLFDPKLPPSANSAFKPMIALIATSPRDFEDLKQFYPQLELNVVALDDLRTAPSLRSCQRMIGLREDIPAPADEFLRKTFRNRYVRITGGIGQIREQLNAWLDNPVTMNTGAPAGPRKQGNGKGQGTGYPKKKQFRRPRPNP